MLAGLAIAAAYLWIVVAFGGALAFLALMLRKG